MRFIEFKTESIEDCPHSRFIGYATYELTNGLQLRMEVLLTLKGNDYIIRPITYRSYNQKRYAHTWRDGKIQEKFIDKCKELLVEEMKKRMTYGRATHG